MREVTSLPHTLREDDAGRYRQANTRPRARLLTGRRAVRGILAAPGGALDGFGGDSSGVSDVLACLGVTSLAATSTRPVVVSIRRIADGRTHTPCYSATARATSVLRGQRGPTASEDRLDVHSHIGTVRKHGGNIITALTGNP